jgi:hypothetical protein
MLPAGVTPVKIKKKDLEGKAAFDQSHEAAWNQGMMELQELRKVAEEGKTARFNEIIGTHRTDQKRIGKLTTRLAVSLSHCPSCHVGQLNAVSLTGQGDKIAREDLGSTSVDPGLIQEVH